MSNLVPVNIQVPAHLAARVGQPSSLGASIASGISAGQSFPRISIKASRFRIVEDGTETVLDTTSLDVIIVGANPKLSKTYYAAAWDPDAEAKAPDCWSLNGISPHPEAENPQNDLCASCRHNAWGSKIGPKGQQLKACTDQKRLAVVAADDPEGPIYLLQVTPAALKGLNAYHKELSTRGIPAEIVKTKVGFDTDASFPKLTFKFGGFLDEDTYASVESLFGSEPVLEITGESQPEAPAAPKAAKPAPVKAAPKAKEPEPEPEAAPAPKRGFGAAKADAPKAAAKPKAAPKPKAEPEAAGEVRDLTDEIAALLGDDDD
jgi:hypothetical protein